MLVSEFKVWMSPSVGRGEEALKVANGALETCELRSLYKRY